MKHTTIAKEAPSDELISNAIYQSPESMAFLRARKGHSIREATYTILSSNSDMDIALIVSPNGNMSVDIGTHNPVIRSGRVDKQRTLQTVKWQDTDQKAVISTRLGHDHIYHELSAAEIMEGFLDSIDAETQACCIGGWKSWHMQTSMIVNMLAGKKETNIEVTVDLPRTTCPGMEIIRPWKLPRMEFFTVEGDSVIPFTPDKAVLNQFEELHRSCMPRASSLKLNAPYMIRAQYTAAFDGLCA